MAEAHLDGGSEDPLHPGGEGHRLQGEDHLLEEGLHHQEEGVGPGLGGPGHHLGEDVDLQDHLQDADHDPRQDAGETHHQAALTPRARILAVLWRI